MADTNLSNEFTGLPLGLLVCQPILEVAKGQAALCDVYLNTLFELAFEYDKQTEEYKARTIKCRSADFIISARSGIYHGGGDCELFYGSKDAGCGQK